MHTYFFILQLNNSLTNILQSSNMLLQMNKQKRIKIVFDYSKVKNRKTELCVSNKLIPSNDIIPTKVVGNKTYNKKLSNRLSFSV